VNASYPVVRRLWRASGLLVAVAVWLFAVALAVDVATYAPAIGLPGLVVAVVGLAILAWLRKSWALAFSVAGVSGFVVVFFTYISLVQVY